MRYLTHQKPRGGTRHLKRLMQQSLTAAPLSEAMLQRDGYDYEKLGLGLWHWHHRQPPQRVRQLAAQHLLVTLFDWQRQLRAQPEPFYLAIWLVKGSDFAHNTQVVAGIGERRMRYGGTFGEPDSAGPPLPPEYCQLPGADTLTWTTHPWKTWLDAFDYPTDWPAWALARPHYFHTAEDGSRFLLVQTSWVWVGQPADTSGSAV